MDKRSLWVSALIISLGIIIGCYLISSKPFASPAAEPPKIDNNQNSMMVDINEASKLLGLSTEDIKMIISAERKRLEETGSYEGTMLPYIVVNGDQYFEKTSLLKWALESTSQHREYKDGVEY